MRIAAVIGMSLFLLACVSAQQQKNTYRIAESNLQLGVGYFQQGKTEAALVKILKALEAFPDYPEAHSSIALVYQQLDEHEKSRKHYEIALELQPGNGVIYNNYGTLLCKIGKPLEAEPHFLQALKSRGYRTPAAALENLGVCFMQVPDFDKADKYLRQALKINPRLPGALLQMAHISFEKKRYMSSRAYLQRLREVAAMGPGGLWLGIKVEKKLGDEEAVQMYGTQLRRKFPDSNETQQLLQEIIGTKAN